MRTEVISRTNKKDIILLNIQSFLLYFLPIAIVTGPFLSGILSNASALIFIYLSLKNREYKYFYNNLIIIYFLWCLFLIISSLFSINPLFSLESSLFFWRFGLFSLSIWYLCDKHDEFLKYFTISLCCTFFVVIADAYYQYFTGFNILGYPYHESAGRLSGFFGDKLFLGNYLARLFPLLIGLILFYKKQSINNLILIIILFISVDIITFLAGERVAVFYLLLSSSIMIVLINSWRLFRLISLIISAILILLILYFNSDIRNRMVNYTISQINITSENYVPDHELLFTSAYKIFKDHQIIGSGPKMFRELCRDEKYYFENELYHSCSTHPHNIYLQLLAEVGIIGAMPVLYAFFYILYRLIQQFKNVLLVRALPLSSSEVCLYSAIIISLWPIGTSMNFFSSHVNIITYLPIGFLLYSINLNKND